jgi:2-dehydropantoate 2-reductase
MKNSPKPINVLLIGSGVIGSVYAAQFGLAGHNVHVLAYGAREVELASTGIRIRDVANNRLEQVPVKVIKRPGDAQFDLIIIAVRANQLAAVFPTLGSLSGQPHILLIGNNPDGRKTIPVDLNRSVQFAFPGISGSIKDGVVEYIHVAQQPTTLEASSSPLAGTIHDVLTSRHFPVRNVDTMDGWLAYHTVFISCISMALIRADVEAQKLGHNRQLLKLMCQSIEEGFRVLRSRGTKGLPMNLMILHTPLLRLIAINYWGSLQDLFRDI